MNSYELYIGPKHVDTIMADSPIRAVSRYGARCRRNRVALVRAVSETESRVIDPMVALGITIYRGCEIERNRVSKGRPQPDEYTWGHLDYDGPGDPRCGFSKTFGGCREDIDEVMDEYELDAV